MDAFLWPLKVAVAWVMVYIHKALVLIGLPDGAGVAWVLSIVGLTIFVRVLMMPLVVKQIRASRGMQLMQPELQALQAKYKGKKDPASKQRQQEEMMALYRKHGTNPLASCMPILLQMPIFFALFRVLDSLDELAAGTYRDQDSIGPLTAALAEQVQASTVIGAPLSASFMNTGSTQVRIVTIVLIIAMSVSQWYTMAQLGTKNMPESMKNSDNPMMRSQRMMITIMPIFFAFTGVHFQIGVLVYWLTSNLWTMGQQYLTIRNMPAPGSEAEKKYRARVNAKRARKGLPSLEEEEAAQRAAELEAAGRTGGQRVQPVRKDRRKGGREQLPAVPSQEREDSDEDSQASAKETGSGLTPEEIARRRYEKRARQRAQRKSRNSRQRRR